MNAGPLVGDQGVQDVANYFRAAAASRACTLFSRSMPWQSLLFALNLEAKVGRMEGDEGY